MMSCFILFQQLLTVIQFRNSHPTILAIVKPSKVDQKLLLSMMQAMCQDGINFPFSFIIINKHRWCLLMETITKIWSEKRNMKNIM